MGFTKNDCGCYIDGAFGMDHAYDVMAGLVRPYKPELADDLEHLANGTAETDEWASEALDEATDILNEWVEEGISFTWEAGDLILSATEDAEV